LRSISDIKTWKQLFDQIDSVVHNKQGLHSITARFLPVNHLMASQATLSIEGFWCWGFCGEFFEGDSRAKHGNRSIVGLAKR
jgi:hypothetical protein